MFKKTKLMLLAVLMFFYEALYAFHWKQVMPRMCLFITDEEREAELNNLKAEKERLEKELEEAKKTKGNPPPAPQEDKTKLEEDARKKAEEEAKNKAQSKKIENAVAFSYDITKLLSENPDILGEEIKSIIDLAAKRDYPNAIEKANELRSAILNTFFSKQANIDALVTESFKKKATEFLALTTIKRNELSEEYWNLLELAVENIKKEKKHEELLKKGKGEYTGSDAEEKYDKKIFGLRDKLKKESK